MSGPSATTATIGDLFDVQDEITAAIVGVVAPELIGAEMQRARRKDPASLDAWDNVMRAMWHALRLTAADGDRGAEVREGGHRARSRRWPRPMSCTRCATSGT